MGKVEMFIDEDGGLKVVQRYDLRPVLRRMRPEGFERHRVPTWPSGSEKRPDGGCWSGGSEEDKFNRLLKVVFVNLLCVVAASLVFYKHIPLYERLSWELTLLGMLLFAAIPTAVIFAVVVLGQKVTKDAGSAPPKREEVQTVSALVQQV